MSGAEGEIKKMECFRPAVEKRTCTHDDMSHLWTHMGNHTRSNPLGELFHHHLLAAATSESLILIKMLGIKNK